MPAPAVDLEFNPHGRCQVSLIVIPSECGNRFVHYSVMGDESWMLRDYITEWKLSSNDSTKTASDIEALATAYKLPEFRAVGRKDAWKADLLAKTLAMFGPNADTTTKPKGNLGKWRRM